MVAELTSPDRPLPSGGATATWRWRSPSRQRPWSWCRVYHRSTHTPDGASPRSYGPLFRFDQHTPPAGAPAADPAGRSVLYVGYDLATSACEVFGEAGEARLCPNYRVSLVRPSKALTLFDLTAPGSALAIGALPSLADAPYPRALTQQWAKAIYEDDPTGAHLDGIRYRSGYNGGLSLALWDADGTAQIVVDRGGRRQDFALNSGPSYLRLLTAMQNRHIAVSIIGPADCPSCP